MTFFNFPHCPRQGTQAGHRAEVLDSIMSHSAGLPDVGLVPIEKSLQSSRFEIMETPARRFFSPPGCDWSGYVRHPAVRKSVSAQAASSGGRGISGGWV
jgi:hypothetical protein